MLKRTLSVFVFLFLGPHLALADIAPYEDTQTYRYQGFEAVYQMKEQGIFTGYPDGTFRGESEINRAELSKVLVLAAGIKGEDLEKCAEESTRKFSDVVEEEWYAEYVYCAQTKGWVNGDNGFDTFRPSDPVLLGEAFKMIVESQYGTPDKQYAGVWWYQRYSNFLADYEIIDVHDSFGSIESYTYTYLGLDGFWDYSVGFDSVPESKAIRHDVAELIYRLKAVLEGDEMKPYNLYYTLEEFSERYGTTFTIEDNKLSVLDSHFGFAFDELPLEKLFSKNPGMKQEDLKIYVRDPSGFENGFTTEWYLVYPLEGYLGENDFFLSIDIESPEYRLDFYVNAEEGINHTLTCPIYLGATVQEILSQICAVDENQNIDAEYLNFRILE